MAIKRTVETDVYCDICGKKGICRECRIKKRIQICSIQRRIGSAGIDSNGMCLGFGSEKCKRGFACTSYEQKETP